MNQVILRYIYEIVTTEVDVFFCLKQATSKLLVNYPEPQRSEILDYLFKVILQIIFLGIRSNIIEHYLIVSISIVCDFIL